jgi:hypothetical protein
VRNRAQPLAGAAANRRVVEADVAAATALAAGFEAIAARLENRAAGFVAGGAADAAAVLGELALADADGQVALAAADAVAGAVAAAEAVAEHAAEILQRATGDFIFAAAVDLEAAGALFEFHFTARQDAPIRGGRRTGRHGAWLPGRRTTRERRDGGRTTFKHNTRCHRKIPSLGPNTNRNDRCWQAINWLQSFGEDRPSFARPLAGQSASQAKRNSSFPLFGSDFDSVGCKSREKKRQRESDENDWKYGQV